MIITGLQLVTELQLVTVNYTGHLQPLIRSGSQVWQRLNWVAVYTATLYLDFVI